MRFVVKFLQNPTGKLETPYRSANKEAGIPSQDKHSQPFCNINYVILIYLRACVGTGIPLGYGHLY